MRNWRPTPPRISTPTGHGRIISSGCRRDAEAVAGIECVGWAKRSVPTRRTAWASLRSAHPTNQPQSRQRLAPNIRGTLDLDQHADAGVGADMGLLAWQEQIEDGVTDRPALVQLGRSVESQKARVENTVALRLEVGVDHANALVVAEVFERLFLRTFPIGEVVVVENHHAALRRDVGTVRALRRDQAWRAVIPGRPDEGFELFTDGHELLLPLRTLQVGDGLS